MGSVRSCTVGAQRVGNVKFVRWEHEGLGM